MAVSLLKERLKPLSEKQKALFNQARETCHKLAEENHIPPRFLASKNDLEHFARTKQTPPHAAPWANQLFWDQLEGLLCATSS